jgi:hypothetical protein
VWDGLFLLVELRAATRYETQIHDTHLDRHALKRDLDDRNARIRTVTIERDEAVGRLDEERLRREKARAAAAREALGLRCVLYKRLSPIARFQHLIAPPFN